MAGIYLFSKGDVHLYAGRTKRPVRDLAAAKRNQTPAAEGKERTR